MAALVRVHETGSFEADQNAVVQAALIVLMPSTTFRCPKTGLVVPRPFAPDPTADPDVHEYVRCPACGLSHLVNKSTARLIGEREE